MFIGIFNTKLMLKPKARTVAWDLNNADRHPKYQKLK